MTRWMLFALVAAGVAVLVRRELPAMKRELKIMRM